MKKIIGLTVLSFFCTSVLAGAVVVHPSNVATMDKKIISKIFLGKTKNFSNGEEAIPLNLDPNDTSAEFTKEVLGKSESQIKAYWSKLLFTGKGQAPKSVSSDAKVIELVSKNPNTIGYVSDAAVTDGVKVALKF